ncbi:MAG: group II truncated hemoglobin [Pseudomonadota bacterium]
MNQFGHKDSTFQAAGCERGIRLLVDAFYDHMDNNPAYSVIRNWHPQDLSESRDRLAAFLVGWMGGPRLYQSRYGRISIPGVHAHLPVTHIEMNMWLDCMADALREQQTSQNYTDELVEYLLIKLKKPANMIREYTNVRTTS